MNRRDFLQQAAVSAVALAGAGCQPVNTLKRRTLLMAGSTTILPYMQGLIAEFSKDQRSIDLVAEGGGTNAGILAVSRHAIDIGVMSRDIDNREDGLSSLRTILIAKDALVIAVHPNNPIADLSATAVRDVFLGRITEWRDLPGGTAGPITVVNRRPGARGRRAFSELALDGADVFHKAVQYASAEDANAAVAATPGAIGYFLMNEATPAIKTLSIDGVPPNRTSILTDRFKYSRPFFLALNGEPQEATKAFIDFCTGAKGQKLLSDHGLLQVY